MFSQMHTLIKECNSVCDIFLYVKSEPRLSGLRLGHVMSRNLRIGLGQFSGRHVVPLSKATLSYIASS